ncbi:uncharacterized protein EDB93DRAFT_1137594 [Suillus bovinus]|uniref:uncharacterized protein n=1 Tax=Suillus bovinus TaxID=48563 RepID=UPI001B8806CA|nr:uncharacterized protein EDB93DRAFT_1137594 [Suillus bovinus]KAG2152607.1 hypothetical protein EDB93DRAFT_1137594 [Suillus bovinus]
MNILLNRASLKRSSRTRTRKTSDAGCQSTLQIIPECSETHDDSRLTLSEFAFSIDDALLMLNDRDTPRSPALSASSSTDDSMPATPYASDDEDFTLPTPRITPKRVTIRPLCINKTRSIVCEHVTNPHGEEDEYDFYTRQFEDFISLYSPMPSAPVPARPESITLSPDVASRPPIPRGRSRFSKALPLLPLPTPPSTPIPPVPHLPASAIRRKRVLPPLPIYPPPPPPVENRPPPRMAVPSDIGEPDILEQEEQQPARPIVIEQVWFDDEEESIYSQPSFAPPQGIHPITPTVPETLSPPRASTDSDASRSSLDSFSSSQSHSSFSSLDSYEETAPISPFSFPPTPGPEPHQLSSRWSCSTISSHAAEPPRTILSPLRGVFVSKSKAKSGSGSWRAAPPLLPILSTPPRSRASHSSSPSQTRTNTHNQTHTQSPYQMPLTRMLFPATPSPPSTPTPTRHIRRQHSRSSTSSGSSESGSCKSGGSAGLRRKPIPIEMFLRA